MVPIVNLIGLSLGLLLWSLVNMLTGWYNDLPPHTIPIPNDSEVEQ
jgi:hypothetical protein